jgi:hypothetical protein
METEFIKWMLLAVLGGFSWFMKSTLTHMQEDIDMIKRDYLHKEDFKEFKTELRSMFEEIKTDIRSLKNKE